MANQGKKIDSVTIEELFKQSTDSAMPILIDIQHDDIVWGDSSIQENGHLRLINDSTPVKYNGHSYAPASFSFALPQEDGKTIGNSKITISCLDQRVIEVIRTINSKAKAVFDAFFVKKDNLYRFSKLYHYEFELDSVTWDSISASWNLIFEPTMQLNVPRDLGTKGRFPSVNEKY